MTVFGSHALFIDGFAGEGGASTGIAQAMAHRPPAEQPARGFSRFDPPGLWESEPRSSADDAGKEGQ